jgi:hypothetical protein
VTRHRTPLDIAINDAIARLTHLMALPDHDLCDVDHRTAELNTDGACTWEYHPDPDKADTIPCPNPGQWGTYQPGQDRSRRGCTAHTAAAIRAALHLQRNELRKQKTATDA